jgi:hypothetical protein
MPLISVITPVDRPNPIHFGATTRSVLGQSLPKEWAVEWIVQEDGPESSIKGAFHPKRESPLRGQRRAPWSSRNPQYWPP